MPTLTSIDVSVTSTNSISLTFSSRALAIAYHKHLCTLDRTTFSSSYLHHPNLNPQSKTVTVALPPFITWFITCRLPDDEDAITFTFDDADEEAAARWAEGMLLFEGVKGGVEGDGHEHEHDGKQLCVKRLWNAERLQRRLEDLRRGSGARSGSGSPRRGPTPGPGGPRRGGYGNGNGNGMVTGVVNGVGGQSGRVAAGWWS